MSPVARTNVSKSKISARAGFSHHRPSRSHEGRRRWTGSTGDDDARVVRTAARFWPIRATLMVESRCRRIGGCTTRQIPRVDGAVRRRRARAAASASTASVPGIGDGIRRRHQRASRGIRRRRRGGGIRRRAQFSGIRRRHQFGGIRRRSRRRAVDGISSAARATASVAVEARRHPDAVTHPSTSSTAPVQRRHQFGFGGVRRRRIRRRGGRRRRGSKACRRRRPSSACPKSDVARRPFFARRRTARPESHRSRSPPSTSRGRRRRTTATTLAAQSFKRIEQRADVATTNARVSDHFEGDDHTLGPTTDNPGKRWMEAKAREMLVHSWCKVGNGRDRSSGFSADGGRAAQMAGSTLRRSRGAVATARRRLHPPRRCAPKRARAPPARRLTAGDAQNLKKLLKPLWAAVQPKIFVKDGALCFEGVISSRAPSSLAASDSRAPHRLRRGAPHERQRGALDALGDRARRSSRRRSVTTRRAAALRVRSTVTTRAREPPRRDRRPPPRALVVRGLGGDRPPRVASTRSRARRWSIRCARRSPAREAAADAREAERLEAIVTRAPRPARLLLTAPPRCAQLAAASLPPRPPPRARGGGRGGRPPPSASARRRRRPRSGPRWTRAGSSARRTPPSSTTSARRRPTPTAAPHAVGGVRPVAAVGAGPAGRGGAPLGRRPPRPEAAGERRSTAAGPVPPRPPIAASARSVQSSPKRAGGGGGRVGLVPVPSNSASRARSR